MLIADSVLALAVVYGLMLVALAIQSAIGGQFIAVNRGALQNVFLNMRLQRATGNIGDNFRHYLSIAFKHTENNRLASRATSPATGAATADISFINLNLPKQGKFTVNLRHVLADFIGHPPRALIRYAKLPFQFLRGNAVAGSSKQVDSVEPKLQGRAAILTGRACRGMDMVGTKLTAIGPLGLDAIPFGWLVALWASMPLPKTALENMRQAGFVIREFRVKLADGHAGFVAHAHNLHHPLLMSRV